MCLWLNASDGAFCRGAVKRSLPSRDETEGAVLPMVFDALINPNPVLLVSINGSRALPFLVDTGSPYPLAFSKWAADLMKLPPNGHYLHYSDGTIVAQGVTVRSARVYEADKHHFVEIDTKVCVIKDFGFPDDLLSAGKIAGVLGMPLLRNTSLRFDFAAKTLTVFPYTHAPVNAKGAIVLPLVFGPSVNSLPQVKLPLPNGQTPDFIIDTGCDGISLPKSVIDVLASSAVASSSITGVRSSESGVRLTDSIMLLLPSLPMGDAVEPDVLVRQNRGPEHALLGTGFLSRFRVTLDFRNKRMILERARDYKDRLRLPGNQEIGIKRDKSGIVIDSIRPDSPAEAVGLLSGDRLLSSDGKRVGGLPARLAQRVTDGYAGTTAELVIERTVKGGSTERKTFAYKRRGLLTFRISAPSGP